MKSKFPIFDFVKTDKSLHAHPVYDMQSGEYENLQRMNPKTVAEVLKNIVKAFIHIEAKDYVIVF